MTKNKPRRTYIRHGILHVCYAGKHFGPTSESQIDPEKPVIVDAAESDCGRARVIVTQKRKGHKTEVETWRSVKV